MPKMNGPGIWSAIISLFLAAPTLDHAQASRRQITGGDARSLVIATLKARGYDVNSSKLELDEGTDTYFPEFYFFYAYFARPERLATIGSFAVDPQTVVVWDVVLCKRIRAKDVKELQKTLRSRYLLGTAKAKPAPCEEEFVH